jgi:monothiol glutaredoxin
MDPSTKDRIEQLIGQKRVVLFMKGTPDFPQCGFSMRAVSILKAMNTDFASVDILADDEVRSGLKEYANWPTFPQLWVDKQLIGGSDIMMEMWEQGELEKVVAGQ